MLGNFSFGDYFKEDAIVWGWEFLTKELNLPKDRLWPSVYKDDDEAYNIWKKFVPESRIARMGEESNFWSMGPTGPCGPCSEIYWDNDPKKKTTGPDDSDRWMEVWNLVFTQFDKQSDGSLPPLPKKNIDTGMGLERLTTVFENVPSNFETSLFLPIISFGEDFFGYKKGKDPKKDIALKIFADHLRAVTLLVFDGILPSNEGRGYVLRRLLRRAVRQGTLFGVKDPFLFKGVPLVADLFKETAEDLVKKRENIATLIKQEEERFLETIETGTEKLTTLVSHAKKKKKKSISGIEVFRLYDTYGFPPELTQEILQESKMRFDENEFNQARADAQNLAREGWKGSGAKDVTIYNELFKKIKNSQFLGYDTNTVKSPIKAIIKDGQPVKELKTGESGEIITDKTPFYPEGGGQVGDQGWIEDSKGNKIAIVNDAQKPIPNFIVHLAKAEKSLKQGDTVQFVVDPQHRDPTKRHHTATHLLHAALRKVLGKTVTQAGSLVSPDRLRFDYTYNKPPTPDQLKAIEDMVNEVVQKSLPVHSTITTPDQARKMGAMALFGEKYGDKVRCLVVSGEGFEKPDKAFSLELCGGTHCHNSGEIGPFKILSDSSLAAGVRRVEAIAGFVALDYFRNLEKSLVDISRDLKSTPAQITDKVQKLLERQKQLEQDVRHLKLKLAQGGGAGPQQSKEPEIKTINGINLAVRVSDGLEVKDLRVLADRLKQQVKSGVVFVASSLKDEDREKVSFVVTVTNDVKDKGLNAGQLAKTFAAELGGSGGGRPDFAQGGGTDKEKLEVLVQKLPQYIKT
jgi:alanyl-tRNA synthetase